MTTQIPLIEVRGSHRDVGQQIGEKSKPGIQRILELLHEGMPEGVTWDDMMGQSKVYLEFSRKVYPQYIEELEGIAEGADVPFDEVFLATCEELWEPTAWQRGCTDMAARGPATKDGSTLVAHNNDEYASEEETLVIIKVQAEDEPEFLGVSSGGIAFDAGYNAAGISLTGNQLYNNDIRPGVPRILTVRAMLAAKHLSEAMALCLNPQRASSYNNILGDSSGEIYSMEGSATDCEPIYIKDNILAHANHYISPAMRRFEADRNDIGSSVLRYNRAKRLLKENYGQLTPDLFKILLADHAGYPKSICHHGEKIATVFSIIIHLEELYAWIGRGHPCETTYYEYQLEPFQKS